MHPQSPREKEPSLQTKQSAVSRSKGRVRYTQDMFPVECEHPVNTYRSLSLESSRVGVPTCTPFLVTRSRTISRAALGLTLLHLEITMANYREEKFSRKIWPNKFRYLCRFCCNVCNLSLYKLYGFQVQGIIFHIKILNWAKMALQK